MRCFPATLKFNLAGVMTKRGVRAQEARAKRQRNISGRFCAAKKWQGVAVNRAEMFRGRLIVRRYRRGLQRELNSIDLTRANWKNFSDF
jgi:hypothetical protein